MTVAASVCNITVYFLRTPHKFVAYPRLRTAALSCLLFFFFTLWYRPASYTATLYSQLSDRDHVHPTPSRPPQFSYFRTINLSAPWNTAFNVIHIHTPVAAHRFRLIRDTGVCCLCRGSRFWRSRFRIPDRDEHRWLMFSCRYSMF